MSQNNKGTFSDLFHSYLNVSSIVSKYNSKVNYIDSNIIDYLVPRGIASSRMEPAVPASQELESDTVNLVSDDEGSPDQKFSKLAPRLIELKQRMSVFLPRLYLYGKDCAVTLSCANPAPGNAHDNNAVKAI